MTLTDAFATVAETLRRSTVQIRGRRTGIGSGIIWQSDGVIISNSHVVRGQEATIELADGQVLQGTVTARNPQRDLVALQVNAIDLPAITIANSEPLRVGELVFAVGNPFGVVGAVTTGIIHTVGSLNSPWIQADVQLAPGNSGGALANALGHVIGINTMIVSGRGFAIPSRVVERFLQTQDERPYLGVTLQPVRISVGRKPAYGLLISEIEPGSPAESARLQPTDVLIGVRGALFQSPDELFHILENCNVGDGLLLEVLRGGQRLSQEVVLYSRHSNIQAA